MDMEFLRLVLVWDGTFVSFECLVRLWRGKFRSWGITLGSLYSGIIREQFCMGVWLSVQQSVVSLTISLTLPVSVCMFDQPVHACIFSVCLQMFLPQLKANAQMEHK